MKIFVSRPLPQQHLRPLTTLGSVEVWPHDGAVPLEVLERQVRECDGLLVTLTESLDADLLACAGPLRAISQLGAGYDNLDVEEATQRGIAVLHTPDVTADATADLTWLLILAATRGALAAMRDLEEGHWGSWDPWRWVGLHLPEATLGIVGLGQIGTAVARRAQGFGVRTVYHSRTRYVDKEERYGLEYRPLNALLAEADIVSLHVSLSEETRDFIGRAELSRMKPGSFLINTSRGEAVDEVALVEALESGHLGGAGLDVFSSEPIAPDHPLVLDRRVFTLPHIGSATDWTREQMVQIAVDNLARALRGETGRAHIVNREVLVRHGEAT